MLKITPILLDAPSPAQEFTRNVEDALPLLILIAAVVVVAIILIRRAMKKRK